MIIAEAATPTWPQAAMFIALLMFVAFAFWLAFRD